MDGEADVVFAAGRRLRDRQRAARAALEFDHRRRVVDHLAPGHQRDGIGAQTDSAQAGDEAREMLRVAADRAHHQRLAAPRRIEHPAQAVVARAILEPCRKPALDVFDPDEAQRAQRAVAHELAGKTRHGISRIRVRDGEQASLPSCAGDEIARLREIVRHRLVADHIEPRVERRDGGGIVRVVRRHDRDGVDGIGAQPLALEHLAEIAVAAASVEPHRGAGGSGSLGIAREHARDRAPGAVELGGAAMHLADPGVRAAPDDAEAQRSPESLADSRHAASPLRDGGKLSRRKTRRRTDGIGTVSFRCTARCAAPRPGV